MDNSDETILKGYRDEIEDIDNEMAVLRAKRKGIITKVIRITRENVELGKKLGLPTAPSGRGRKPAEAGDASGDEGDEGDEGASGEQAAG